MGDEFDMNENDWHKKVPVSFSSKLVSEFLGTFMLVLTVGLNVIGGSKAPVFSIAASLMCMIYALGSVSGAHFNPAVTVAIATRAQSPITWEESLQACAICSWKQGSPFLWHLA